MVVPRRRRKRPCRSSSPPSEARQSTCAHAGRARPRGVARRRRLALAPAARRSPLARGATEAARQSLLACGAAEVARSRAAEAARSPARRRGGACSHMARWRRHGEGELTSKAPRRPLAARRRQARRGEVLAARQRRLARAARRRPARSVAEASSTRCPSRGAAEAACSRLACSATEAALPHQHGGGARPRRPRLPNPADETRSLSQCEFQSRFTVLETPPRSCRGDETNPFSLLLVSCKKTRSADVAPQ